MKKTTVRGSSCKLIVKATQKVPEEMAEQFRCVIREQILANTRPSQINPQKIAREILKIMGDPNKVVAVKRDKHATVWRVKIRG